MQAWREVVPETYGWRYLGMTPLAGHLRAHNEEIMKRTSEALPAFHAELCKPSVLANLTINPDGKVNSSDSRVLETLFSTYEPLHMGIVDYHGAHRQYTRQQIGGINLNLESSEQKLKQHALYGYSNKYSNLKEEMASAYVKHLLAREAGATTQQDDRLTLTLKELFATFFPGKEFLGPQPTTDGTIQFHVKTPSGALHDIDDLSSGEKEVLYGYLRMRNSAPKHSVLLIDEPELHLNPRLISGLASFYRRYLAQELSNQLWLVTHSDTLIREAVGQEGYKVFHMQPPDRTAIQNQASLMTASDHVERVVIDLVGDLAAYRPGAKIVLFEGGGDTDFDVRMTCTLFPKFQSAVNPISSGNKRRVHDLHEVLEEARQKGAVPGMFFSITDRDTEPNLPAEQKRQLTWDVYHIENYLLDSSYIFGVLKDLVPSSSPDSEQEIYNQLLVAARSTVSRLVAHRMRTFANSAIVGCVDLGFDPTKRETDHLLQEAISRSKGKIDAVVTADLSPAALRGGFGKSDSMISGSLASPAPPRGGRRKERGNEEDETESRSTL